MATKVNKLYIQLAAAVPPTVGAGAAVPTQTIAVFNVTETTVGVTVAADRFGRFLQEFQALSSGDPANQRGANDIEAWFQESPVIGTAPGSQSGAKAAIDFISATGVATTAVAIDPTLTRNFRVRAIINRLVTVGDFARTTLNGHVYVQRQHTLEA